MQTSFLARPERVLTARAAVGGVDDAREAWEALAARGVIPLDWCENARRAFPLWRTCPDCEGNGDTLGLNPLGYRPIVARAASDTIGPYTIGLFVNGH